MFIHDKYTKHLYNETLPIIRVRCRNKACRKTHAIIPSFSTPCCSTGTAELDSFIRGRADGETVDVAGQCFCDAGMSPDYPESIHRRLKKYHKRIQALCNTRQTSLSEKNTDYATFLCALADVFVKNTRNPATVINLNSTHFRCNPFLFSRKNIVLFLQNNSNEIFSHNPTFRGPP